MSEIVLALKRWMRSWCPSWVYGHVHLFRVLRQRWWYDRQILMDTAHTDKEWDFEWSVEQDRHERVLSAVSKAHPAGRAAGVLEVGCSEGVFTRKLAASCASVTAYDISPVACARAAQRCAGLTNVSIRQVDLQRDAIEGMYDWVFAMDILEYIHGRDRLASVVDKLVGALKAGGLLIVSDCRLPDQLRRRWWQYFLPEGADALIRFITNRSGLCLVHQECHPDDGTQIRGYFQHIIAVYRKAR